MRLRRAECCLAAGSWPGAAAGRLWDEVVDAGSQGGLGDLASYRLGHLVDDGEVLGVVLLAHAAAGEKRDDLGEAWPRGRIAQCHDRADSLAEDWVGDGDRGDHGDVGMRSHLA